MKLRLDESSLKSIVKRELRSTLNKKEIDEDETPGAEEAAAEPTPEISTSAPSTGGGGGGSSSSGGAGTDKSAYPTVTKWGDQGQQPKRSADNLISNTKWASAGQQPNRGPANQISEQGGALVPPIDMIGAGDTRTKKLQTFYGPIDFPIDDELIAVLWDDSMNRQKSFANAKPNANGEIMWGQSRKDKNGATTMKWYNPPAESILKEIYKTGTIRYIEDKIYNHDFFILMTLKEEKDGYGWIPRKGYFTTIDGEYTEFNPDDYIHKTPVTHMKDFVSEHWGDLLQLLALALSGPIAAWVGLEFLTEAMVETGLMVGFAGYDFYKKNTLGGSMWLFFAALPYIKWASKLGISKPFEFLNGEFGQKLVELNSEEEILKYIDELPEVYESDKIMIKRIFKQIPQDKLISWAKDNGLRTELIKSLKNKIASKEIDLGKIPAGQLKWWKNFLLEGGAMGAMVGFTYKSPADRLADQKIIEKAVASGASFETPKENSVQNDKPVTVNSKIHQTQIGNIEDIERQLDSLNNSYVPNKPM
jgi:hypothetical protein